MRLLTKRLKLLLNISYKFVSGKFSILTSKSICITECDLSRISKRRHPCLHHTHMRIIKEYVACKDIGWRYMI